MVILHLLNQSLDLAHKVPEERKSVLLLGKSIHICPPTRQGLHTPGFPNTTCAAGRSLSMMVSLGRRVELHATGYCYCRAQKTGVGARPPSKGVGWNSRWAKNHEKQELKASGVSRRISASLRDHPRRLGSSASATPWTFPVWFFVSSIPGLVQRAPSGWRFL